MIVDDVRDLSRLTFGTMRLHGLGSVDAGVDLVLRALDQGVTTFHVSSEYESWPFFVDVWTRVRSLRDVSAARFIGKIGIPHFGQDSFDPEAFGAKIDLYRQALDVPSLAIVQWLLRFDLKQEERRLEIFRASAGVVAETVAALKRDGVVGALVSFPYTQGIADLAIDADWCDGLALYVNPLETELEANLARLGDKKVGGIAIRPFAAGRVFKELGMTAEAAMAYAVGRPSVRTVVASISSTDHLDRAIAAVA